MEAIKSEKAEGKDNRSFLAKYVSICYRYQIYIHSQHEFFVFSELDELRKCV